MRNYIRTFLSAIPVSSIQLALRAAVAAALSFAIAQFLELQFPIFAAVAAVIATDLVPSETLRLGQRRLLATVVGTICGALLRLIVEPSA